MMSNQHNVEVILDREGSLNGCQKTGLSGETERYRRVTNVLYQIIILIVVVILSQIQYNNIIQIYEGKVLLCSINSCKKRWVSGTPGNIIYVIIVRLERIKRPSIFLR